MIRLLKGDSLPVSLKSDPFGCRLWAAWSAYREYETLCSSAFRIWEQEGSGLYLGLVDDALLLFSAEKRETGQEDWEEISSFLPLSGARKVLCPAFCGERLGFSTELRGRILRKKSAVLVKEAGPLSIQEEALPSLRVVYDLLIACRSQTFCPPAFEPFYLDLSHRLRHHAASLSAVYQEKKLAAVAIAPVVTEEAALLAGVAVDPEFRRRGLGTEAVRRLMETLSSRVLWVFRAEGENKEFYTSLGFQEMEAFLQLSL